MARPVMWKETYKAFVAFKVWFLTMPSRVSAPLFLISLSDQTRAAAGECWKVHIGFMLQVELDKSIALSTDAKRNLLKFKTNYEPEFYLSFQTDLQLGMCDGPAIGSAVNPHAWRQWSILWLAVMPAAWKRSPLALTACAATVALFLGAPTTLCGA